MNKKLFLFVLPLVLISLCVNQPATNTTGGFGLEATDFSSDQSQVFSGRTARLTMTVDNLGQSTVYDQNSTVYLFGSNFALNDTTGISWTNATPDDSQYRHFGKDMKPADTTRGVPADRKVFTYRLLAPTLPRGQSETDEFTGRIYYDYQTVARGTVWAYSEAESDAVRNSGGALQKSSFTSSKAPISVDISVGPDPPIVTAGDNTFSMSIILNNVGGGTVYKTGVLNYTLGYEGIALGTDDLNHVYVNIGGASGLSFSGCTADQEIIGQKTTLICDVTVDSGHIPPTKTGFSPVITISYGYYVDKKVSLEVVGK